MTRSPSAVAALALVAGLLVLPGAAAGAQITTGLRPPPAPREIEERAAAENTIAAVRDSVAVAERLDMRAWVDSAARSLEAGGAPVAAMPDVPGDTAVLDAPPVPSVIPSPVVPPGGELPAAPPTTRFREGAPAPDTATPLPALLLVAAGLAGGGAALLRRR